MNVNATVGYHKGDATSLAMEWYVVLSWTKCEESSWRRFLGLLQNQSAFKFH